MNLLLENKSIIQRVLENSKMGVWIIELKSNDPPLMHVDKTMMELLGIESEISPEECYQVWYENIDPAYKNAVDQAVQNILKKEKTEIQYRWRHPFYGWRYVRCGGELVKDQEETLQLAGYHQDITDRIMVQREKERIEQLYNDVTSSMGKMFGGIFQFDLIKNTALVIQSLHFPDLIGKTIDMEKYLARISEYTPVQEMVRIKKILSEEHIRQLQKSGKNYFTEECFTQTKSEGINWYALSILSDQNDIEKNKVIVAVQDINTQKRSEEEKSKTIEDLRYYAQRDPLTGLYNRAVVEKYVECFLEEQSLEEKAALLIVDVDDFKGVNDTLGHMKGDEVIIETANILQEYFRESDTIGRWGGDEFVVFMRGVHSKNAVCRLAEQLTHSMKRVYGEGSQMVEIGASVGIALYPEHGKSYQQLCACADKALYQAKRTGKNGFALYQE